MYHVYVLHSEFSNKIYIGFTSNLEARLTSHNHPNSKGWTRNFKPWKIIHTEIFPSKPEAMKREKELKSAKGREFIWGVILKQGY